MVTAARDPVDARAKRQLPHFTCVTYLVSCLNSSQLSALLRPTQLDLRHVLHRTSGPSREHDLRPEDNRVNRHRSPRSS
jgi:hypothetical protein